jgi:hypothetical protein
MYNVLSLCKTFTLYGIRRGRAAHRATLIDRDRHGAAVTGASGFQRPHSARCPNNNKDEPRPGAAGSGTHTHSDTGPDGDAPGTAHPCGRADIGLYRSYNAQSCSAVTSTSASCTPSPTHRAWPLSPVVPLKDDRRAAHSAQLGAYGHTSTDMIMWGDFSALHGSVKVIWDELRYSRRMRRLDRSSMLLLLPKVAPC